jgi:hypothetical protein
MPRYLTRPGSSYYIAETTIDYVGNELCYTKSMDFLDTLSKKLKELTDALKVQFDDLKKRVTVKAQGPVLASVVAKTIPIGVKQEYVLYIKEYGPPVNGKFDENLLQGLRQRLGIVAI